MCKFKVVHLYISQNANLTEIFHKEERFIWLYDYFQNYKDCIASLSLNKRRVKRLLDFEEDFKLLVKEYFTSLNYGSWTPNSSTPYYWVTMETRTAIKNLHAIKKPLISPHFFSYNYFRTYEDASGLEKRIKELIRKYHL